jgi:dihydrofolate reductase
MKPLALVVAIAKNGVIGKDGQLPWRIPEDLRHFKNVTMGHTVIMGRKTFDSIGRVLPGRRFVIVSRKPDLAIEGAEVASSLDEAIAIARKTDDEPRIIGGAQIYEAALPQVTKVYVTEIQRDVEGDAFFHLDRSGFREVERRRGETEEVEFVTLER